MTVRTLTESWYDVKVQEKTCYEEGRGDENIHSLAVLLDFRQGPMSMRERKQTVSVKKGV